MVMPSLKTSSRRQAAALLLCLASATAFQQLRPLAGSPASTKSSIVPGRAPVDVSYVDDKTTDEHVSSTFSKSNKPQVVDGNVLTGELVLEVNLTEEQVDEALNQKQEQQELLEEQYEKPSDAAASAPPVVLTEHEIPALPTLADYRKFALPCLGLLVSGPLLSLVDTAFVGMAASSSELAALGPATTLFDCLTWLLTFLNVATTNLYSTARAKGSQEETEGVVRTGSRVGLTCGIGVMATLILFCKPILAGYMGPQAAATPGLLSGASSYLQIRALSMPTFLLTGVLQSALLGEKDSITPLVAILYSTVVNILGDYFLVNTLGMGLKGAAIATTVSGWVSCLALLLPARKKLMSEGKLGLLNFKKKSAISLKAFMSFAAPVVTLLTGKLAAFGFLTQAAAKVPGQPTPLASHQIVLSLFLFLAPFVEVINQTAQTFLPPFYAPVKEYVANMKQRNPNYDAEGDTVVQKWNAAGRKVSNGFLKSCFLVAAMVATAGSVVPSSLGHTLTRDVAVQNAMKPLAKFLWWSTLLMGPMSATEGILLANHKTWFLATMYMASTAVFPFALMNFGCSSIASIWFSFTLFQGYRAFMQTLKVTGFNPKKILSKTTRALVSPFFSVQGQMA